MLSLSATHSIVPNLTIAAIRPSPLIHIGCRAFSPVHVSSCSKTAFQRFEDTTSVRWFRSLTAGKAPTQAKLVKALHSKSNLQGRATPTARGMEEMLRASPEREQYNDTTTNRPFAIPDHIIFSNPEEHDQKEVELALSGLLQRTRGSQQPVWNVLSDGAGIERRFKFKTFKAAWEFMEQVTAEIKRIRHHPEWANTYNHVFVRWTTHRPHGISLNDVRSAEFCDERAREIGEVLPEVDGQKSREGAQIALFRIS